MILDYRGMGYFSDLDTCEVDDDEEEGVVDQDGKEIKVDVKEDDKEVNVEVELEEKAEAGVRLRQHKRPGLLRTRSMSSGDVSEFDLLDEREKKFQSLSPASRAISDGDLTEKKEEEEVMAAE